MTRLYLPQDLRLGDHIELPTDAAHHVRKVLRVAVNDVIEVFNGEVAHQAEFTKISKSSVEIQVGELTQNVERAPLKLIVVQSVSRGERMDFCLQKSVELGAAEIIPIISERTVVRLDRERQAKRLAHWRGVIQHATEQSGRIDLPRLGAIQTIHDWLAQGVTEPCWLLHPDGEESLAAQAAPGDRLTLLAGPEGGFSDSELALFTQHDIKPVHLGPRVLRTESAAITALAVAQALWGDLR